MNAALAELFPKQLRSAPMQCEDAEEFRLRIARPVMALTASGVRVLQTPDVTAQMIDELLERAMHSSAYAYSEQLRAGFLYAANGCRIGLCGTVFQSGEVGGVRQVTSLAVRVPHEVRGCAEGVASRLFGGDFRGALLLSPPGGGKTTLLRDLIRCVSERGYRVAVADERGELAGVSGREMAFDLGPMTDVMTGGTKRDSAMMLLRAMNPQILAFDEITAKEDLSMITEAAGCGVALLATVHAASREDLCRRPLYRSLLESNIFPQAVWISRDGGRRRYSVEPL